MWGWGWIGEQNLTSYSKRGFATHKFCKTCGCHVMVEFDWKTKAGKDEIDPRNDTVSFNVSILGSEKKRSGLMSSRWDVSTMYIRVSWIWMRCPIPFWTAGTLFEMLCLGDHSTRNVKWTSVLTTCSRKEWKWRICDVEIDRWMPRYQTIRGSL